MFKGKVYEFPITPYFHLNWPSQPWVWVGSEEKVYRLNDDNLELFLLEGGDEFTPLCDGVLLGNSDGGTDYLTFSDERKAVARAYYSFDPGNSYFSGKLAVGYGRPGGEPKLYVLDLEAGKIVAERPGKSWRLNGDDNFLYVVDIMRNKLVCFDYQLNEKWRTEIGCAVLGDGLSRPELYENLVIITTNKFVKAFVKDTGDLKWEKELCTIPISSILFEGKIFLSIHGNFVVIDPIAGEVVSEFPSGFLPIEPNSGYGDKISLHTNGEYLFSFSLKEKAVRVYSMDAELLQELKMPREYAPLAARPPIFHGAEVYQVLANHNCTLAGGILVLTPTDEGEEGVITVEDRPAFIKSVEVNSKNENEYRLTYFEGSLEELLRFIKLDIEELAQQTGASRYVIENRDKHQNGRVSIEIQHVSEMPAESKKEIKSMLRETQKSLEEFGLHAGDGKHNFKLKLRWGVPSASASNGSPRKTS